MAHYIYIIGSFEKLEAVKIGMSRYRPYVSRLPQIQTCFPYLLHLYAEFTVNHQRVRECEKEIHKHLNDKKLRGEWFNIHPRDAIKEVSSIVNKYKINKRT